MIANIGFVLIVVGYLGVATRLTLRSPNSGCGLPMFLLSYFWFLAGLLLVDLRVVAGTWLVLAGINMVVQFIYLRSLPIKQSPLPVLLASFFMWPLQFGATVSAIVSERVSENDRATQRKRIGTLPAVVRGTVSFSHHIGSEKGEDLFWLEEYGELGFRIDAALYDRIGVAEGAVVQLTVDAVPPDAEVGSSADELWVTAGERVD
ncbi:hypothetical protein ABI59_14350 [Acidobacteria bacterium Mor1]|nr:hypothetical protein ABI59_14350 [Acidobacteria bacterium Mor1]